MLDKKIAVSSGFTPQTPASASVPLVHTTTNPDSADLQYLPTKKKTLKMEIIWLIFLILIIFFSIRSLMSVKKLLNDKPYSISQHLRFYRLLFIIIGGSITIVIYAIKLLK